MEVEVKVNKYYLLLITTFLIGAFFLFYYLGRDIFNDDAHFWYQRSTSFVEAIEESNWEETFQNTKPGVTLQWLSGFSLETFFKLYFKKYGFKPLLFTADTFNLVHFAAKAPLALVSLLFLLPFAFVTKRLYGGMVALLSTIFLATQPYYIGVSRFLHVEGLLTVFMSLSALFFMLFIHYEKKKKVWLFLSAIMGGLAFLSKTQAVYLLMFIPLVLSFEYLESKGSWFTRVKSFIGISAVKDYFKIFGKWLVLACVIFTILFPAMWVEPQEVVGRIIGDTLRTGTEGLNNIEGPLFYFMALPLRMTPLILLFSLLGLLRIGFLVLKQSLEKNKNIFWVVLYILGYIALMSFSTQKIDRYMLAIFPFLSILGSVGVIWIWERWFKRVDFYLLSLIILILSSFCAYTYLPYLSTYYNPLLGGRDTARKLMDVETIGEVYPEVGKWLNVQSSSEHFVIQTSYIPHSLRPFARGTVIHMDEQIPEGATLDYVVTPWYQELREEYSHCPPIYDAKFKDQIYWKVYDCRKYLFK